MNTDEKIRIIKSWTARFQYEYIGMQGKVMVSYAMVKSEEDIVKTFDSLEHAIDGIYSRIRYVVWITTNKKLKGKIVI